MSLKRIAVNYEGDVYMPGKRSRPDVDPEKKEKVIMFIVMMHEWAGIQTGATDQENIDHWREITSWLHSCWSMLRQDLNVDGKVRDNATKEQVFRHLGDNDMEIEPRVIKNFVCIEKMREYFRVIFRTDLVKDHAAIGSITSLLSQTAGFGHRFNEVRVMNTGLNKGQNKKWTLASMGLSNGDAVLFEGATYPPIFRSSVAASIGPLTLLAIYLDEQIEKYASKWEAAIATTFSSIPGIMKVIKDVKKNSRLINPFLHKMALLCYAGINRTNNKVYLPYLFIRNVIKEYNPDWIKAPIGPPATGSFDPRSIIHNIDLSGHGFWATYELNTKMPMYARGAVNNGDKLGQMIMLAITGLHKEDLSLVEWMTGQNMYQRKDMPNLMGRAAQMPGLINLPKFKYVCKLASAAQGRHNVGSGGQYARVPVLSGKCCSEVREGSTLRRKLVDELARNNIDNKAGLSDYAEFDAFFTKIASRIDKQQRIDFGTTEYYMGTTEAGAKYGELVRQHPPVLAGKFWFAESD